MERLHTRFSYPIFYHIAKEGSGNYFTDSYLQQEGSCLQAHPQELLTDFTGNYFHILIYPSNLNTPFSQSAVIKHKASKMTQ